MSEHVTVDGVLGPYTLPVTGMTVGTVIKVATGGGSRSFVLKWVELDGEMPGELRFWLFCFWHCEVRGHSCVTNTGPGGSFECICGAVSR